MMTINTSGTETVPTAAAHPQRPVLTPAVRAPPPTAGPVVAGPGTELPPSAAQPGADDLAWFAAISGKRSGTALAVPDWIESDPVKANRCHGNR